MPKLIIEIAGDATSLERSFARAEKATKGFGRSVTSAGRGATTATLGFKGLGRAVASTSAAFLGGAGLVVAARAAISEFSDAAKVSAQTAAALKSTGSAAGVTAGYIDELASSISAYSGQDDEAVQAGENLLLTFTQIRNEVGKGNDIFTQATKASADLSQAMGIDMTRAALQVGKALNDPARGYARLQRIGVAFTAQQVQQIKGFVKLGETQKAQGVILAELNREFGGSARAFGETLPGKIARLRESILNLSGTIVGMLAPAFEKQTDRALKWVQNTENQKRVLDAVRSAMSTTGDVIRAVTPVIEKAAAAAKSFADAVGGAKDAIVLLGTVVASWKVAGLIASFTNIGKAAGAAGAAGRVGLLTSRLQTLAAVAAIPIVIEIIMNARTNENRPEHGFASWSGSGGWGKFANDIVGFVTGGKGDWRKAGVKAGKIITSRGYDAIETARNAMVEAPAPAGTTGAGTASGGGGAVGTATVQQRNAWFDAMIGRQLNMVQDIPDLQGQIAALNQIAGLITQRIAATKDITRKLTLEDQLRQVMREARGDRAQLAQESADAAQEAAAAAAERAAVAQQALLDQLQLAVDRTALTDTLQDDLKALKAQLAGVRQAIATQGATLALKQQLLGIELAIKDKNREIADQRKASAAAAKAAAEAAKQAAESARQEAAAAQQAAVTAAEDAERQRQYVALGLLPSGDEPILVTDLRKQLVKAREAVKGTALDTKDLRKQLDGVAKVLSLKLGVPFYDVGQKIQQILDDIIGKTKSLHVEVSKFRRITGQKFVESLGLNLTPLQKRTLSAQFATLGPGMSAPTRQSQLTGGGGGMTVNIQNFHSSAANTAQFEDDLARRAKGRPQLRRGT